MKILCVSDQIDPLIYNQNAHKNFPDIDLILCAGDLPMDYVDFIVSVFNKPTFFVFGNHDLKEFKFYHGNQTPPPRPTTSAQSATSIEIHYEAIKEDHHHGASYAGFKNLSVKHLKVKNKRGRQTPLLITGVSGSIKYNDGLCQYTDTEMLFRLLLLVPKLLFNRIFYGRFTDILLTHATPFQVHDHDDPCHRGFKAFNLFIKFFKPEFMVHGHIHLYDNREERVSEYEGTTVINAFAHHVFEFNTDKSDKTGDK